MAKEKSDDLFETGTMTFGEHLEELRSALIKCLIWLGVGVAIGLFFADDAVKLIKVPLTSALESYYRTNAEEEIRDANDDILPPEDKTMLKKHDLVPDKGDQVAIGILFSELRKQFPEECASLPDIAHLCTPEDLPLDQIHDFCTILVDKSKINLEIEKPGAPTEEESLLAARHAIWAAFTPSQQEEIKAVALSEKATVQQQVQVVSYLNDLIRNRRLAESDLAGFSFVTDPDWHATAEKLRVELEGGYDQDASRRFNRLVLASAFNEQVSPPCFNLITLPTWKPAEVQVQSLKAEEAFMIWLKAAVVVGLMIASPGIFWHIWNFVSAGLYKHERRFVWIYLPFSLILFFAGVALAFNFVFEPVLNFLFSFNRSMDIDPDPRISEWLGFVLFLPIGFGISFQLPLVMLFLNRLGIFSVPQYLSKWRIAILVIFVLSMLLTPADPVSMLLMAIPMTFLYFLGVMLCQWMPRNKSPFGDPDQA